MKTITGIQVCTIQRPITIGEIVPIVMPWSEVCMHMRIAERAMLVRLERNHMATPLYLNGCSPYCPAITSGEAGIIYRDSRWHADVITGSDRDVAITLAISEADVSSELWPAMAVIPEVLSAYAVCALWSSTDDDMEPLDGLYGPDDLAPEVWRAMASDVVAFMVEVESQRPGTVESWGAEQFGDDFWLTRNGHGAGFWDRGKGELGDWLAESARVWGESDLYVGDDGEVYVS